MKPGLDHRFFRPGAATTYPASTARGSSGRTYTQCAVRSWLPVGGPDRPNDLLPPRDGGGASRTSTFYEGQCLRRGLVDEILLYVLPVLLGDGNRFSPPALARIDLAPISTTRRAPMHLESGVTPPPSGEFVACG